MQSVKLAVVVHLIHLCSILYIAHAYAASKPVQWYLPSKGLQLCMSSGALSSMGKITIRQGDEVCMEWKFYNDNNVMLMRTYRSSRGLMHVVAVRSGRGHPFRCKVPILLHVRLRHAGRTAQRAHTAGAERSRKELVIVMLHTCA